MKKLIEFKYDNKRFLIALKNNKIEKYVIENNKYKNKLSNDEQNILNYVISQLLPSNDLIKIKDINLGSQNYEVYVDKKSNIKVFNPFPNIHDLKTLNILFNNQNECVAIGNFKNKDFYKRIVKVGNKLVVVIVSLSVCLTLTSKLNNSNIVNVSQNSTYSISDISVEIKNEPLQNEVGIVDEEDNLIEIIENTDLFNEFTGAGKLDKDGNFIPYDEIYDSTTGNKIVEDSEIIETNNEFTGAGKIDKDGNFIPYDEIYDAVTGERLNGDTEVVEENVEIVESEEVNSSIKDKLLQALEKNTKLSAEEKEWFLMLEPVIVDNIEYIDLDTYLKKLENIYFVYDTKAEKYCGLYNYVDNYIEFSPEKNSVPKSILTHELLHTLSSFNGNRNEFLTESINVMFNNEYFSFDNNYDESYSLNMKYIYFLREIIGTEPLIAYQFDNNFNYILSALYNIIPDENKCYKLLEELAFYHNDNTNRYEWNYNADEILINQYLNDYYVAKYGKGIEDNIFLNYILGNVDYLDLCKKYNVVPAETIFEQYIVRPPYFINPRRNNNENYIGILHYVEEVGNVFEHFSIDYEVEPKIEIDTVKIYNNGNFIIECGFNSINVSVGLNNQNKIGYILKDNNNNIIYESDSNLRYITNSIALCEYIFPDFQNSDNLELNDYLNEDYLIKYTNLTRGFTNLIVENDMIRLEPNYVIEIKNDLERGQYTNNLNECYVVNIEGKLSIFPLFINLNIDYDVKGMISLNTILKHYNIINEEKLNYSFTIEELREICNNYIEENLIERGR
ncbi:MAG: hypothetical protein E7163_05420 [Firmicutes bacterium]|nr:hypothetical protein [Bacillota bacterium]